MAKKSLIIALFLVLGILAVSNVRSTGLPTVVNGHVYEPDGITPVSGATVDVSCDDPDSVSDPLTDTTDSNGFYVVEYAPGECDIGSTVEITSGGVTETDTVTDEIVIKNIVYVNLTVPEFTTMAALVAVLGSVLIFTIIRRKH